MKQKQSTKKQTASKRATNQRVANKQPMNKQTVIGIIVAAALLLTGVILLILKQTGGETTATSTECGDYIAEIVIKDYGTITVELDGSAAPITVRNFVELAESGYYDGKTFHRIINGFMMQGGAANTSGGGGSGKTIKGEFTANGVDNPLKHTRGAISMARSNAPDSASSQFFIVHTTEKATHLDGKYACFGYVTSGLEIVDAICTSAIPINSNGLIAAVEQPVIETIRVTPKDGE